MQADNLYDLLFDSEGQRRKNEQKIILNDINLLDSFA